MDVGRNAAAIVAHGAGAVGIERDDDFLGKAGKRFVDGVVDDLVDHVMQARAVVGVADIHAGAFAHGIEPLEHLDRFCAVIGGCDGVWFTDGFGPVSYTHLAKDTAHKTVYPVFTAGGGFAMAEMQGGGDFVMVADPATFKVLPWELNTGWLLCDIYFTNGKPVPFSTRQVFRDALARLAAAGFDFVAGLEVEFHLFRLENPRLSPEDATWPPRAPKVSLLNQGYQYLTESRFDQIDAALEPIRRGVAALGMPLRSLEIELGPSQCEFTFRPQSGLATADTMILFRAATKQIARRHGYLASFMCRPALPNIFSSGWHLHQSLIERKRGTNAFAGDERDGLSMIGFRYLGGLLAHANAAAAFTTPTVNGYKRYRPYTLAPDRAIWARDNRGVMLRVLGQPGDAATHLENRVGEPAANP